MTGGQVLRGLAARRLWVYAGGLAAVAAARLAPLPGAVRVGLASLALTAMVATYAGEQVADDGRVRVRSWPLAAGIAGVAAGVALALTGTLAGLVFLGGGLLFLRRALDTGGARP